MLILPYVTLFKHVNLILFDIAVILFCQGLEENKVFVVEYLGS